MQEANRRYFQIDPIQAARSYDDIMNSKHPKGRILVAEDNRLTADILSTVLIDDGYQVDIAHNGRESLRLVHQTNYDLVSMDLTMPYVDGIQAIIAMEIVKPKLPVLVLSGNLDTNALADLRLCSNVKEYISKPADLEKYLESVRNIVSSRRQRSHG